MYGKPPMLILSLKPPILMLPDDALMVGTVRLLPEISPVMFALKRALLPVGLTSIELHTILPF